MFSLHELDLVRIAPAVGGVFAFAKYPEWSHEYNFFVPANGSVAGKTTAGAWMEVSVEMASFIRAKVHAFANSFELPCQ
jgi:hypothetical protein